MTQCRQQGDQDGRHLRQRKPAVCPKSLQIHTQGHRQSATDMPRRPIAGRLSQDQQLPGSSTDNQYDQAKQGPAACIDEAGHDRHEDDRREHAAAQLAHTKLVTIRRNVAGVAGRRGSPRTSRCDESQARGHP